MASVIWISPPAPGCLVAEQVENLRLQDVAAGDDEVRRRVLALRLLHHAGDPEAGLVLLADADDAVAAHLVLRHFLDRDDVAAVLLVGGRASAARQPGLISMSGRSTAKGSRPTSSRAHQTAWPRPSGACWRVKLIVPAFGRSRCSSVELFVLPRSRERRLELVGDVEMVRDDALVAAGDEDEMLDPRLARLVDHILQRRTVDDRQHLLRHGLGGGEEARAEAGDGKDGLAERIYHARDLSIASSFPIPYFPHQRSD